MIPTFSHFTRGKLTPSLCKTMSVLCAELTYLNRLLRSCSIHVDIVAVDRGWRLGKVLHHHKEMAEVGNWFFAARPRGFPAFSISGSNLGGVFCPWSQILFQYAQTTSSIGYHRLCDPNTYICGKEGPILVPIWNIYSVLRHPGQSRLNPFVHRWWSRWLRFPSPVEKWCSITDFPKGDQSPEMQSLFIWDSRKKVRLWGGISAALLFFVLFFLSFSGRLVTPPNEGTTTSYA